MNRHNKYELIDTEMSITIHNKFIIVNNSK